MKVKMYKQVIELSRLKIWSLGEACWECNTVIEEAEQVDTYLKEAEKEDVSFCMGVYRSPRLGEFTIKYRFIGEQEESWKLTYLFSSSQ